jgi:hypothetical protein
MTPTVDLAAFDDEALSNLGALINDEQKRRAVAIGDIDAIVDLCFETAFSGNAVLAPWIRDGLLVCPGLIIGHGTLRHDCTLVKIEDDWSWMSSDQVANTLRHVPYRAKIAQQSITLAAVADRTKVTQVVCKLSGGAHRMVQSTTYEVTGGDLVVVEVRKGQPGQRVSHGSF